jgi:Lrp/AsnC family leucine-responsive transcriptional regulator
MTLHNEVQIDEINWRILKLLQDDARASFRQIGECVGLTPPAVAERVRRLEEAGVIAGYHAQVDLAKAGRPVMAFVYMVTSSSQSMRLRKGIADIPAVIECHCITGVESYVLKVAVPTVAALEHLLFDLKDYGEVRTSVVLSSQVERRTIQAPGM